VKMISKLKPKVGVCAFCSPMEVGAGRASASQISLSALLKKTGCEILELGVIDTPDKAASAGRRMAAEGVDAIAVACASWLEDYLALDMLEEYRVPILLWPLPGMESGALCGTQQLTCYLKQLGVASETVFGELRDRDCLDKAMKFLRAASLFFRLRRARIGLAGQRVRGMTEVAVNEIALKTVLGPRVVPVDIVGLLKSADTVDKNSAKMEWNAIRKKAGKCRVSDDAGIKAALILIAMREVVNHERLSALAFGCYPDFMGYACLAASVLADEGIPVGCEGDVNTVVAQLILSLLTGQPTHNTDWLDPMSDGSVVFTHCGSGSYSLAENMRTIELAPVRLVNQGVCSLFPARTGDVTLVSMMPGITGYQMAVMKGKALKTKMVFPGNPLRVKFSSHAKDIIQWIHNNGIGHHWAAGYGHVADEIRYLSIIAGNGLKLLKLEK